MGVRDWRYDANDVQEFPIVPLGDHRVRIEEAEETTSRNGNDMIKLKLSVSGHAGVLFDYIVFMPDNTTQTNTKLKRIWDSFGIEGNNLNYPQWVGKVGAARVRHDTYNGEPQAKISYYINRDKQSSLPAWIEKGSAPTTGFTEASIPNPFDSYDLPV